jgi:GAF domain-containing protein
VSPGAEPADELELLRRRVAREHSALRHAEEIAERATRDLYDRQVELTLLGAVASASNQAGSIEDALRRVLNLVGEHTGWPVADARLVDPDTGRLVPTDIWYLADEAAYEPFRQATEARSYSPDEGLPGQVLSRAEPIWIEDISDGDAFVRRAEAIASGLRCAFAVPIMVGDDGVGVMEFLNEAPTPRDEGLLALMTQIGTQLGRVVERDRNRTRLQGLADELAAGNEELARSNADLQTFASVASHDLSEPLRTTAGFLELLRQRASLEGQSLELLEQAIAEIERLKGMITGVLEFARAGGAAVRREPVELGHALELAIAGLQEQIAASAADIDVRDALPLVSGDLDGLTRVFQNLISNAIKLDHGQRHRDRSRRLPADLRHVPPLPAHRRLRGHRDRPARVRANHRSPRRADVGRARSRWRQRDVLHAARSASRRELATRSRSGGSPWPSRWRRHGCRGRAPAHARPPLRSPPRTAGVRRGRGAPGLRSS